MTVDRSGALYGTTFAGGSADAGNVFKLTPSATPGGTWTETVLHDFSVFGEASPEAGVLMNAGVLYGATIFGGSASYGMVFKLVTFAGAPGQPNCIGESISLLAQQYGGLAAAAVTLGYSSVQALQSAIMAYCDE